MPTTPRRAIFSLPALLLAGFVWAGEPCPPAPPPPGPAWTGSLSGGLSVSSGNTSTQNFNLGFNLAHDPKQANVFKADGLYLRQQTDGKALSDKTSAGARDEHQLGPRTFAFGELRYLRDPFKGVRYLVSPVAGFGYKLVDGPRATLSLDGGLGGRFEKLVKHDRTASAAVQAGQALTARLSASTTLTQRVTGLWQMSAFGDALYRLEVTLGVSLSKRLELKLTDYFDHKTRPASPELNQSDNALVAAVVVKIG